MGLFDSFRNMTPMRLIMIFLTVTFLAVAIQGALSNYYYQTNKLLNEEILNLTSAVQKQSELERFKITLLLNSSLSTLIKKIDKTTESIDDTTRAIQNQTRSLQQQNVYFFKAAAIQDQFRGKVSTNLTATQNQINEILANQQLILLRLNTLANNKTMSQTLDNVLEHQQAVIKLLLNRNQSR